MFKKIINVKINFPFNKYKTLTTLTHTGPNKMVNITTKQENLRYAKAQSIIKTKPEVIELIKTNQIAKGDVLRTAEIAGIMAAKNTFNLIPLCHQINLSTVKIRINLPESEPDKQLIKIESYAESVSKTGVEMEAMVAASITALTIYDMCKAADKTMEILETKLIEKFGGKSGHFKV
jgi:cyclic pyranopterin phosphate synthase